MSASPQDGRFRRLIGMLSVACWMFAALGVVVASGPDALLAPWSEAAARSLLGREQLGAELVGFAAFTNGVLGGSIAGKWVAAWWLVRGPLRQRKRWAWNALVAGLLAWFGIDSAVSLALGAGFNVWMINLWPLVIVGGLLAALRRHTEAGEPTEPPRVWPWKLLWLGMAAFAVVGVVVAVAIRSPIFDLYNSGLRDAFFAHREAMPADAVTYQRFAFGLIGATFAGHFVMLAWAARRAARERWVLAAIATSIAVWFVIDTTACLVHGALFNVLMINLPSLLAIAVLLALAARDTAR
jgi:hypothetical protein